MPAEETLLFNAMENPVLRNILSSLSASSSYTEYGNGCTDVHKPQCDNYGNQCTDVSPPVCDT